MNYDLKINGPQCDIICEALNVAENIAKGDLFSAIAATYTLPTPSSNDMDDLKDHCNHIQKQIELVSYGKDAAVISKIKTDLLDLDGKFQIQMEPGALEGDAFITTLSFTSTEANLLQKALELYSRLGLGQIDIAVDTIFFGYIFPGDLNGTEIRYYCDALKKTLTGFPSNASHGIGSHKISDDFRVAWDIQQVVRNKTSWDRNPKGGMTVNFDKPMKWSQQPLPTIESIPE